MTHLRLTFRVSSHPLKCRWAWRIGISDYRTFGRFDKGYQDRILRSRRLVSLVRCVAIRFVR